VKKPKPKPKDKKPLFLFQESFINRVEQRLSERGMTF
jgi:hypothetical protein